MTRERESIRSISSARMRHRSLLIKEFYAVCLLGATFNHARLLVQHGLFWDYGDVPLASAVFWTSLTLLDPLTVILLFVHPNVGVVATGLIIVADVVHNLWIIARYTLPHRFLITMMTDPFVVSQVVFLVFVAMTTPAAWMRGRGVKPLSQLHRRVQFWSTAENP